MRGPKTVVEAILRDLAYDEGVCTRLGITKDELALASRWVNAMPSWRDDITKPEDLDESMTKS